MALSALLTSLLLAASPFVDPRVVSVTPDLKADAGRVISVSATKLTVSTPIGPVSYVISPTTVWVDRDGRVHDRATVGPGQSVRLYFVYADGAKLMEVDAD